MVSEECLDDLFPETSWTAPVVRYDGLLGSLRRRAQERRERKATLPMLRDYLFTGRLTVRGQGALVDFIEDRELDEDVRAGTAYELANYPCVSPEVMERLAFLDADPTGRVAEYPSLSEDALEALAGSSSYRVVGALLARPNLSLRVQEALLANRYNYVSNGSLLTYSGVDPSLVPELVKDFTHHDLLMIAEQCKSPLAQEILFRDLVLEVQEHLRGPHAASVSWAWNPVAKDLRFVLVRSLAGNINLSFPLQVLLSHCPALEVRNVLWMNRSVVFAEEFSVPFAARAFPAELASLVDALPQDLREVFVALASSWEGSVRELLEASRMVVR